MASKHISKCSAVALQYDDKADNAPVISARGSENSVKLMKSIARRYGVPIAKKEKLLNNLENVRVSQEIPSDLYLEVAELFQQIKRRPG